MKIGDHTTPEDPDLKVLPDWGIKKDIEYGTYQWHPPERGHSHIRVDGRAVVPVAILSKVIEAVHCVAHPGTHTALELFKRQFHVCNLSGTE